MLTGQRVNDASAACLAAASVGMRSCGAIALPMIAVVSYSLSPLSEPS